MAVTINKNGKSFSHSVALGEYPDIANLRQFGKSEGTVTGDDIWDGSSAYPINTADAAMEIISDSTDDTFDGTGARVVQIFGVDENWIEHSEKIELRGTTAVTLSDEFLYVHVAEVIVSGSGNTNAGNIKVQTVSGSTLQAQISTGVGRTLMAIWAQPAEETLLIDKIIISSAELIGSQVTAEFAIQVFTEGTAIRTEETFDYNSNAGFLEANLSSPVEVPEKSLVRVRCLFSSASSTYAVTLCGKRYFDDDKVPIDVRWTLSPIQVPGSFTAGEVEDIITLDWTDTNNNESGYEIWRSETSGSGHVLVKTTAENIITWDDGDVSVGTTYYYIARAVRNGIAESGYASEVSDSPVVLAPNTLAAAEDENLIALSWVNNSTVDTAISIERSLTTSSGFNEIDTVAPSETTYDDITVTATTQYFYKIRALADSGYSAYTSEVNDTAIVLPPDTLAAAEAENLIALSWVNNSTKDTAISISRSETSGSGFSELTTVDDLETTYDDTTVVATTTYYYKIRALASSGYSVFTSEVNDTAIVLPPTSMTAVDNEVSIDLAWTNNSVKDTLISIERSESSGSGFAEIDTVADTITVYDDVTAVFNTLYYYRIRALASSGYSVFTSESSDSVTVLAPTSMTATPGDGTVALAWTNNSSTDTAILIDRSETSGSGFSQIDSIDDAETTYDDGTAVNDTEYWYKIRAQAPNGNSAYTAEANATPTAASYTAVVGRLDIGSIGSLNGAYRFTTDAGLTWAADAVDGATAETGFLNSYKQGPNETVACLVNAATDIVGIYTTTNGTSWTDKTSGLMHRHWWIGDRWMLGDGTNLRSTTDFITYATLALSDFSGEGAIVGTQSNLCFEDGSNIIQYSDDGGATISPATTQQAGIETTPSFAYLDSLFWRIDTDSLLYKSSNGDTWTDTSAGFTQGTDFGNTIGFDGTNLVATCSTDGSTSEIKKTPTGSISWSVVTVPIASRGFTIVTSLANEVLFLSLDGSYGNAGIYTYKGGSFVLEDSPSNGIVAGAFVTV